MHLTWLDNNSWLIETNGCRVLLDPWLVGQLVFNNMSWLIRGYHVKPRLIPDKVDLILLSQGLEDHAHPETLKHLKRDIPIVCSPNAVKLVTELGYQSIKPLSHGETYLFNNKIRLQATPGAQLGPFLVENGYILEDIKTGVMMYYEPHGFHPPRLQAVSPIDVVIAPVVNLTLPVFGPIIQGKKTAPDLIEMLQPKFVLPTAAGNEVTFEGAIASFVRADGSIDEFRTLLAEQFPKTALLNPKPGDRIQVAVPEKAG